MAEPFNESYGHTSRVAIHGVGPPVEVAPTAEQRHFPPPADRPKRKRKRSRIVVEPGMKVGDQVIVREVKAQVHDRPSGRQTTRRVLVRCRCGREREVQLSGLMSGRSKQCQRCASKARAGRRRFVVTPGMVIDGQVVLREVEPRVYDALAPYGGPVRTVRRVLVRCGCGRARDVSLEALKAGDRSRCHPCGTRNRATSKTEAKPPAGFYQPELPFGSELEYLVPADLSELDWAESKTESPGEPMLVSR